MEWMPIETAVKDERCVNILLCAFSHDEDYEASITVGFWSTIDALGADKRKGWCDFCAGLGEDDYWTEFHPTHWQPLPPVPKQA